MIKVSEVKPLWGEKVSRLRLRTRFVLGALLGFAVIALCAFALGAPLSSVGDLLMWLPIFGAVTNTAPAVIAGGRYIRTFTITATADADVASGNIAHGMLNEAGAGVAPDTVIPIPIQAPGALKAWAVTTIDATNVVLTGNNVAGSGVAGASLQVFVIRWPSWIR